MKTLEDILSDNLTRLRKSAGFRSREKFAEIAGIHFATYRDIESGRSWPEKKNLRSIASAIGVPETELFRDPSLDGEQALKDLLVLLASMDQNKLKKLLKLARMISDNDPGLSANTG